MEFDHIKPIKNKGRTCSSNLQALHKECHKQKTREDRIREKPKNIFKW